MFESFDFKILDSPDYGENAVREDIITPLLNELGYSPSGQFSYLRDKSLSHPFVKIGSKTQKISIIPDYVLSVDGKYECVLDAKSPKEKIFRSKHLEQVYSFAIHPDIRSQKYGLCNGREIVIYELFSFDPLISLNISSLTDKNNWQSLYNNLSPVALSKPHLLNFKPDYGLHLLKAGVSRKTDYFFYSVPVFEMTKVNDGLFTFTVNTMVDGSEYMISFDIQNYEFKLLMKSLPDEISTEFLLGLTKQPYKTELQNIIHVNIKARIGEIESNADEKYVPFQVIEITLA